MSLDKNGYLRRRGVTIQYATVAHHYLELGHLGCRQIQKPSHTRLDKIMSTVVVDEDHDTMMTNKAIHSKGFWCRHPCRRVKANLRWRIRVVCGSWVVEHKWVGGVTVVG